ncbi:fatty acid desaturase [Mameliella alba]|nr:fatty acid desaturase [Mameliella alba]MBY6171585.1 fatty acid desaturase [Mameliella alba]MBY6176810.1 fatty acid desaturase [Mameliella alba]
MTVDHREALSALSPQARSALTERSDEPGLWHLAGHLGGILTLGGLIAIGVPGWFLLLLPQGVLLVFLFTLLHETVHDTPFRTAWLNRWAGAFCGLVLFLPPVWFRWFHFAHHRYTQDPERDPELASAKPETLPQWVLHVSGVPVWIASLRGVILNAFYTCTDGFVPKARRADVRREARIMLAIYAIASLASLASGSALLLWVWLIPMALGQPFLRLYLLAEHGFCPYVANMLENTRTTFTNRIIRWLAWNMPYHAEHHSFPTVPFHKLPELHRYLSPHLKETERGYRRFTTRYLRRLS